MTLTKSTQGQQVPGLDGLEEEAQKLQQDRK